jgi:hypothetical protein
MIVLTHLFKQLATTNNYGRIISMLQFIVVIVFFIDPILLLQVSWHNKLKLPG